MPHTFVLREEITVRAPLERCFLLSTNLRIVAMVLRMKPEMDRSGDFVRRGDRVRWRGWQLGMPQFHASLIEPFEPPVYFRDSMISGRFAAFEHDHRFTDIGDGCVLLADEIRFVMPLGFIGSAIGRWVLAPHIRRLLRERFAVLKRIAEGEDRREYVSE